MDFKILAALPTLMIVCCDFHEGGPAPAPVPEIFHNPISDFSPLDGHEFEYLYEYGAYSAPGYYSCALLLSSRRLDTSGLDTVYAVAETTSCTFKWTGNGDYEIPQTSHDNTVIEKSGRNHYSPYSEDSANHAPIFKYNAIDSAGLIVLNHAGTYRVAKFEKARYEGFLNGGFESLYIRDIGLVYRNDDYKHGYNTGPGGWHRYRLRRMDGVHFDADSLFAAAKEGI